MISLLLHKTEAELRSCVITMISSEYSAYVPYKIEIGNCIIIPVCLINTLVIIIVQ